MKKLHRSAGALAAFVISVLAVSVLSLPAFDRLHGLDDDILHLLRDVLAPVHSTPTESPVAVIAITPESFSAASLNGIPSILWTDQMAKVQQKALDAGARVYGWDVILQNSAAKSMSDILSERVALNKDSERALRRLDRDLLLGMKNYGREQGRVVLGYADLGQGRVLPHAGLVQQVGGAANLRPVNAYTDRDGVLRGVGLLYRSESAGTVPSFALEIAARTLGTEYGMDPDAGFLFAGRTIPTFQDIDGEVSMRVNFDTGPGAIPTYRFHDILSCGDQDYLATAFADRAVMFGFMTDLEDRKPMSNRFSRKADMTGAPMGCDGVQPEPLPFARSTEAGVFLHAQAVANLISGHALQRPDTPLRIALVLVLALAAAGLGLWWRPFTALAGVILISLGYGAMAALVFRDGTVLPLIDPIVAAFVTLGGMVGFRFFQADAKGRIIRQTFAQYLDESVIRAMIDSGEVPELGGESRTLTCFFSDIEAFSTLSENMTPPDLVAFLNVYFQIVGEEIEAQGGIIERFIGDAVCAVFGAPVRHEDHAIRAVRAALGIHRRLALAQADFNIPSGKAVRTRIGINTGTMVAGNIGARRRKSYTVQGDAVNLAARLESINKQYGTLLIAGEETVKACGTIFDWRRIDRVRVVGRKTPLDIFEPLGEPGETPAEALNRKDRYETALWRFQARDFNGAMNEFQALATSGDTAADLAIRRCQEALSNPLRENWDGVTDLTRK
jgi:adenylate cyclase